MDRGPLRVFKMRHVKELLKSKGTHENQRRGCPPGARPDQESLARALLVARLHRSLEEPRAWVGRLGQKLSQEKCKKAEMKGFGGQTRRSRVQQDKVGRQVMAVVLKVRARDQKQQHYLVTC